MIHACVFLDRDSTLQYDVGYPHKIEDLKFLPGVLDFLAKLSKTNYKIIIITNQSGIGRGIYNIEDFFGFNNHLIKILKEHNITIKKTYFCPHMPGDNCECRKPKIKFLKEAEKEFCINLQESFVIGDRKSDFEMGKNAGCKTIHVFTGNGNNSKNKVNPDYFAKDLLDAAKWILENDQ